MLRVPPPPPFTVLMSPLLMLVLTTSCASIISDSQYPVTLSSNPDEASVTIHNKSGQAIYKGKTPTTLTLPASDGFFSGERYTVTLEKDGYSPQVLTIDSELDGWYVANILFGGVLGLLIIDPATGAMWKLPESKVANLSEETASVIIRGQGRELRIAFADDLNREAMLSDMKP